LANYNGKAEGNSSFESIWLSVFYVFLINGNSRKLTVQLIFLGLCVDVQYPALNESNRIHATGRHALSMLLAGIDLKEGFKKAWAAG